MYITLPGSPDSVRTGVKYFFLPNDQGKPYAKYQIRIAGTTMEYETGSGYIIFTRRDDSVATGTFEFTGNTSNGDSAVITEGVFDISKF